MKSIAAGPLSSGHLLARGDHPNSRKNAPRMEGQMKIYHVGSHQFRESLRELLRELWFSYCSSRGMPFREWNFEFRELLRGYPGIRPRNLRTTPTKSMINIAIAKLVVVRILSFSQVPTIRAPPPKRRPSDKEGLLWGWCVVGGPLRNSPRAPRMAFSKHQRFPE